MYAPKISASVRRYTWSVGRFQQDPRGRVRPLHRIRYGVMCFCFVCTHCTKSSSVLRNYIANNDFRFLHNSGIFVVTPKATDCCGTNSEQAGLAAIVLSSHGCLCLYIPSAVIHGVGGARLPHQRRWRGGEDGRASRGPPRFHRVRETEVVRGPRGETTHALCWTTRERE